VLWITQCSRRTATRAHFNAGNTMGSRNTWTAPRLGTQVNGSLGAILCRRRGVISVGAPEVSNMRLVGYHDLQAPPPAINLEAIAGRALPAMPRRSIHRSGCACEGGVRGDHVRGDHHPVQTA